MFKYKWSIEFTVKDETIERKCYQKWGDLNSYYVLKDYHVCSFDKSHQIFCATKKPHDL
jgi:hypothetical protein